MKIVCYTNNQESHNLSKMRKSTDINKKMTQIMELSDKDLKVEIIKMFH